MTNTRGFTLIELMVALVLMGLVSAAVFTTLSNNNRVYNAQLASIDMQQQVRATGFILPAELRELSAAEGDLAAMAPTELTIHAMRQLGFICAAVNAGAGTFVIDQSRWFGFRWFDNTRDSILIFAEGNAGTRADDRWLHAEVRDARMNTGACTQPKTGPGATITVNVSGGNALLAGVSPGAPVRGFEVEHLALYRDADGRFYLGSQSIVGGAWTTMQPVAGPLMENGLEFAYFDSVGNVTGNRDQVRSIELVVRGESTRPVGRQSTYLQDSLRTRVYLRNNPRP
jgi:prepilin-type N-terminal cleavage/methylation domain-containing protein